MSETKNFRLVIEGTVTIDEKGKRSTSSCEKDGNWGDIAKAFISHLGTDISTHIGEPVNSETLKSLICDAIDELIANNPDCFAQGDYSQSKEKNDDFILLEAKITEPLVRWLTEAKNNPEFKEFLTPLLTDYKNNVHTEAGNKIVGLLLYYCVIRNMGGTGKYFNIPKNIKTSLDKIQVTEGMMLNPHTEHLISDLIKNKLASMSMLYDSVAVCCLNSEVDKFFETNGIDANTENAYAELYATISDVENLDKFKENIVKTQNLIAITRLNRFNNSDEEDGEVWECSDDCEFCNNYKCPKNRSHIS